MNKPIVVIFSGAGLSAESGIPTFRASDGLWHEHKIEDVASPAGWKKDSDTVLKFYEERYKNIQDAEPNEGHRAIARLQDKYEVINITQNIDNLLERAGCTNVKHLHGVISRKKCENYDRVEPCDYYSEGFAVKGDECPKCKGRLRPDVVWFGEAVDMDFFSLMELQGKTFAFIGVGTSANVQPAASLLNIFGGLKEKHFVDPNPPGRLINWTLWQGKAGEQLPKLVSRLLEEGTAMPPPKKKMKLD